MQQTTLNSALMLNPEAELWLLPGEGLLGIFPDGLQAFTGVIAEDLAMILDRGPMAPEMLFAELARTAAPDLVFAHLQSLRRSGLIRASLADPLCDAPDPADLDLPLWPGDGSANPERPWLLPGALSDLGRSVRPSGPWIPVEITARRIVVGPLFRGDPSGPCPACLATRSAQHDDLACLLRERPDARRLQAHRMTPARYRAELDFLRQAVRALSTRQPGPILIREASGHQIEARALRVGGCPECSAPPQRVTVPADRPAILRAGGYRPLPAAEVLAQLDPLVDPLTGVIRDLVPLAASALARPWSHVMLSRHAFPLAKPDLTSTLRNRQGRSAGKGRSANDARAGAMAEAYERYAGVFRDRDADVIARMGDLDGTVVAPQDLLLHGVGQYASAALWRGLDQPAAYVPDPIGPDDCLEWTKVHSLDGRTTAWAPTGLCWHQYRPSASCRLPGLADSNGCAAGQTLTDACLQGLLELVERDAVGIWWWSRARRPRIDLAALDDPWITGVAAMMEGMGYDLALRDLTHDLGVPVLAAIGWPQGNAGPLILGFGAHPSFGTAALRAVSEALQALPDAPAQQIGGAPWQGFGLMPGAAAPSLADFDFLRPRAEPLARIPDDRDEAPPTAELALAGLDQQLTARGLQVWTLDQSRPDVPLVVVRMLVPGLRHFRPRLAPGRLETVPCHLGWPVQAGRNPCFIRQ